jgi:hypothetical protein
MIVNYLGEVFDLATGSRRTIEHPLTGQPVPWTAFTRTHGCNHPVASESLVLVRAGTPAFVDLSNFSGTNSLGGFRSSCQNNLIAADGVLSVPRYAGCHCAYPLTTSLALVHMPDAEMWSCFGSFPVRGRVKRVGLNLGAPGDRRADDGTLWLDYPSVGGPSPDIPVKVAPEKVEWFRHHSTWAQGEGLKWVAASGCKGLTSLVATLAAGAQEEKPYTVRLCFIEPDGLKPGERVFSVALQGREVLKDLDIAAEAGGSKRPLVREFRGIIVKDELTITVTAKAGAPVLCGVEIVAEGW